MTADDLTPGTPRPARVGDTVHTASELDALPAGSIVRADGEVYERIKPDARVNGGVETWRCLHEPRDDYGWRTYPAVTVMGQGTPVTVLFRPDAPQPVTENSAPAVLGYDDAVERAARATWEQEWQHRGRHDWDAQPDGVKAPFRADARAALAAQRDREAVDREALVGLLQSADRVGNYGDMADYILDHWAEFTAPLAARGDATPTEVEWGVRYIDGSVNGPTDRATAEYLTERDGQHFPLVQRTVSAWREVS